jgi:hypothetical protein
LIHKASQYKVKKIFGNQNLLRGTSYKYLPTFQTAVKVPSNKEGIQYKVCIWPIKAKKMTQLKGTSTVYLTDVDLKRERGGTIGVDFETCLALYVGGNRR